jgi:hypothetical protein
MGNLPQAKIIDFYEQFKQVAVTFTKEVIGVTGLLTRMVNLKCGSDFFPCVIYSTSFEGAKIVANNKSGILDKLQESNSNLSIRFCFKLPTTDEQIAFLVPARVTMSQSYQGSSDMSLFTLTFSQRPPDDLIEIMGLILEANFNFSKRKDEYFPINPQIVRKMRLLGNDIAVTVDSVVNRCILRELAFDGVRFILKGDSNDMHSIMNKTGKVRYNFDEPRESHYITGKFVKVEVVVSHPDMAVVTMQYIDHIPMTYKTRLCSYINTIRLEPKKTEEEKAPPPKREIVETLSGSNPIALAAATGTAAATAEAPTGETAATTEAPAEKTASTPETEPAKADTAAKK